MNVVTFNRLEVYYYIYIFIGINFSPGFVLIPYFAKERQISNKGRLHGCHIYSGQ